MRRVAAVAALLVAAAATAQVAGGGGPAPASAPAPAAPADGIVPVPAPTGDDPAALAARVRALEARLDALWSVTNGPEIVSVDTVDRLATRMLALESRVATVEEAAGLREVRAHSHGDAMFEVALALVLLDRVDWTATDDASQAAALRTELAVRAVAWPMGLQAKAAQLEESWKAWAQAASRKDAAQVASLAPQLAILRRDLALGASNWVSTMIAAGGHDHSGLSQGAHADHSPHHGGQVAMKGDTHVELTSETAGTWRVYLSDAFRQPLRADGWTGTLVVSPDAPDERKAAFAVDAAGASLVATTGAIAQRPIDLRVSLTAPEGMAASLGPDAAASGSRDFFVDFQFIDEGPAGAGSAPPVHPPGCPMAPKN